MAVTLAACEVVKMVARQIEYEASAFFNILLLIVLIIFIFAAIKEYRDDMREGFIRFPKAFAAGAATIGIAFFLFFAYMLVHYQFIDKDGLDRINQNNKEIFYAKIEKDTISQSFLNQYVDGTLLLVGETKGELLAQSESGFCEDYIDSSLALITRAYRDRLLLSSTIDTNHYTYKTFPEHAQHTFFDVYQNFLSQGENQDCGLLLSQIMNNSYNKILNINILNQVYEERKSEIPSYTSIVPIALSSAFSVLLFGLFLNLFVSLYLMKKRPEETANPAEETPQTEESGEQNIENKN